MRTSLFLSAGLVALAAFASAPDALAQPITCSASSSGTPGASVSVRGSGFSAIPPHDPDYVAMFSGGALSAAGVSSPLTVVSPTELRTTIPMRAAPGPLSLVHYEDVGVISGPTRRRPRVLAACSGTIAVLPVPPVLNQATVTSATTVLLRWTDVLNETGYAITDEVLGVQAQRITAPTNATSATITIPAAMATHTLRVAATNAAGASTPSNARTVMNFAGVHVGNDANAQYDVVSVHVNGQEQLPGGTSIGPSRAQDFQVAAGTFDIWIGVITGGRTIRLPAQRVSNPVSWNSNFTFQFHRVTLGDLMTQGTSPRIWRVAGTMREFQFLQGGSWEHWFNGVREAVGASLTEVSFARNAINSVVIDLVPPAHGQFDVNFPWGVDAAGTTQTPNFSTPAGVHPSAQYDRQ